MSYFERLTEKMAVVATIDPDAYTTGEQNSDVIDMKSFRRVVFILMAGTLGTSATLDMQIEGDTDSGMATALADITGKAITQLTEAGTDSDKQAIIEVTEEEVAAQGKRYIRAEVTLGAATSDYGLIALGELSDYLPASEYDLTTVDEIVA